MTALPFSGSEEISIVASSPKTIPYIVFEPEFQNGTLSGPSAKDCYNDSGTSGA